MLEHRRAGGAILSKPADRHGHLPRLTALWTACLAAVLLYVAAPVFGHEPHPYKIDTSKVMGPKACGECHKPQVEAWEKTRHATAAHTLARNPRAIEIARAMGLKRVKEAGLCLDCHFTAEGDTGAVTGLPLVGVSCESCHGASRDWIRLHSRHGMKESNSQSIPAPRGHGGFVEPITLGMIGPADTYAMAATCLGCHFVSHAALVGTAGHPAGGAFELVAWSQGEVRHNFWFSSENRESSPARKRKMYVVGKAVELEFALRALARTKRDGTLPVGDRFGKGIRLRRRSATEALQRVQKLVAIPQVGAILAAAKRVANWPPGDIRYDTAADRIAAIARTLDKAHLGDSFAAMDILVPTTLSYRGKPPS